MNTILHKTIKTICLFSFCFSLSSVFGQAPQKMSYQAVIRNATNTLVANASIKMRISVLQGTATGTAVYVETQTATTNVNGLATVEIGAGTVVSGTFASIAWGSNAYFIKTETDPTGGNNYTIVGTSQFLSVPYALFASNSGTAPSGTFVSSEAPYTYTQTIRNDWVDCPSVSLTVPVTGTYLLTFFGGVENDNQYNIDTAVGRDSDCKVRVIVAGQEEELFNMNANIAKLDSWQFSNWRYYNMQPSRSAIVSLTAGQILKIQYQQYFLGTLNGETWDIEKSGISILKIGN
jgi:hypothetical protein